MVNLIPREKGPRREFFKYLFLTALPAVGVFHLIFYMWTNGVYGQIADFVTLIPFFSDGEAGVEALVAFTGSLYFSWLAIFTNRRYKRFQGVILSTVSVLGVIVLWIFGIGVPNIDLTSWLNWLSAGVGFCVAVVSEFIHIERLGLEGSGQRVNLSESSWFNVIDDRGKEVEFPIASRGILGVIAVVVVSSNVLSWVMVGFETPADSVVSALHAASTVVFLFMLAQFVRLEPESPPPRSMEVIGPSQSGKTYSALAFWLTVDNSDKYDITYTGEGIDDIVEKYNDEIPDPKDSGDTDTIDWGLGPGQTAPSELGNVELSFRVPARLNESRMTVRMTDHSGELLEDIVDYFGSDEMENASDQDRTIADGGSAEQDEGDEHSNPDEGTEDKKRDIIEEATSVDDASDTSTEEQSGDASDAWVDNASSESSDKTNEKKRDLLDEAASPSDDRASASAADEGHPEEMEEGPFDDVEDDARSGTEDPESEGRSGQSRDDQSEPSKDAETKSSSSPREQNINEMVNTIKAAETLVLLIDSERFLGYEPMQNDPGMMLSELKTIADSEAVDEVVLAASKADYLINLWNEEYNRPFEPHENYEQFSQDVTELLTSWNSNIKLLAGTATDKTIYPVYFRTKKVDDEPKPVLDEYNQMQPIGYDRLLEAVRRHWRRN